MFVDSGPVAKPEDRDASQGRQRTQIWLGTVLPLFSREEPQDSVHLAGTTVVSAPRLCQKRVPAKGSTVYLAFDQGHWGSLQKHLIGGQLLSHTLGKGGQFKESLDKTPAVATKPAVYGAAVWAVFVGKGH